MSKTLECALEAQRYIDELERENKKLKRIIKSLSNIFKIGRRKRIQIKTKG